MRLWPGRSSWNWMPISSQKRPFIRPASPREPFCPGVPVGSRGEAGLRTPPTGRKLLWYLQTYSGGPKRPLVRRIWRAGITVGAITGSSRGAGYRDVAHPGCGGDNTHHEERGCHQAASAGWLGAGTGERLTPSVPQAPGQPGLVTVPHPKSDIPRPTLRSIYRQAGWDWRT